MHIDRAPGLSAAHANAPGPKRKVRRSVGERLLAVLVELAGEKGRVVSHSERNWASITFAGARHQVEMLFEGAEAVEAGEDFIAILPEHEFTIPRQLVADAAIVEVDSVLDPPQLRVKCELLLLEEG